MKKELTRTLALFLALLMSSAAFSCGDTGAPEVTTDGQNETTTAEETKAEDPDSRQNAKDDLPELNFDGAVIRVLSRGGDNDTKIEFGVEESSGDVVEDAVYARDIAVQERLNVRIESIVTDKTRHYTNRDLVSQSVLAGSDEYDINADALYGTMPLVLEGMFTDINKLNYIDPSKPWWNGSLTEELGRIGDGLFVVTGELALSSISGVFCTFFNKTIFGDTFTDDIYKVVNDGKWTMDKLHEYCQSTYRDLNGDAKADQDDFYGLYVRNKMTLASDAFLGGAKIDPVTDTGSGIKLTLVNDRVVEYAGKLKALVYDETSTCRGEYNDDTILTKMNNSSTIFLPWMLGAVENLREMKDDFGIIPIPKLDENQADYSAYVHNGSTVFTIPKTCQNPDMAAAFLEAMSAESYRNVVPAYFGTAIKVKYSRDEPTSQMLDLIVASTYLNLPYVFSAYIGSYVDVYRELFTGADKCDSVVSLMTSKETAMNAKLQEVMEIYSKLK